MSEREKLPNLKTNSKLIKLQEEINGVTKELLEEDEMDITDINNLIYTAATIMTQTLNEPSKRSKNRRKVLENKKAETDKRLEKSVMNNGNDNGKLKKKNRKIFKKYKVTNAREVAQLTETLKQKVQAKPKIIRRYKKGKPSIDRIRCLKKSLKNFTETWS